ncbi:hypothetical protein [Streptomyces sp. NPDC020917]|uniref:hypothetical protein n=1 Tax=Streptomyces sp. NPDC020917 TaxID=3365102 RepID=UPI0037AF6C3E
MLPAQEQHSQYGPYAPYGRQEQHEQQEKSDGGRRAGRLDLNVPQVAGSAVAAVVAAKLASNLGVYGTIAGAGVVSVLGTCGGTILQHFFRRTGRHMQEVAVQARPGVRRVRERNRPGTDAEGGTAVRTVLLPEAAATDARPLTATAPFTGPLTGVRDVPGAGGDTDHVDHLDRLDRLEHPGQDGLTSKGSPAAGNTAAGAEAADGYGEPTSYRARRRGGWKRPAVAVALAFGLTMAGITGYEAVAGESIGGGHGTTIGNAVTGHSSSHSGGSDRTPAPGPTDTPSGGATSSPYGSDVGGRPRQDTTPSATQPTGSPSTGAGSGTGTETGSGTGAGAGNGDSGGSHTTPTPTTPPPTSASPSPTPTPSGGSGNVTDGGVTP